MAWTITAPLAAPVVNPLALVAGGSLAQNTTYYVRVQALVSSSYFSIASFTTRTNALRSPGSTETSITTDTTNLSFSVSWAAVTGATRYQIFVSTTSGDYSATNSAKIQQVGTSATVTTMTSALNTSAFFAYRSTDTLPGGLSKENGNLYAVWSGAGTPALADLQTAINSAGYSGYCYYDGTIFVLQGSIFIDSAATGTMALFNQTMFFLWGGIYNEAANASFNLQFGSPSGTSLSNNACNIYLIIWSIRFLAKDQKHYGTTFKCFMNNSTSSYALRYGGDDRLQTSGATVTNGLTTDGTMILEGSGTTNLVGASAQGNIYFNQTQATANSGLSGQSACWESVIYDGTTITNSTFYGTNTNTASNAFVRKNVVGTGYIYFRDCTFVNSTNNLPAFLWQVSGTNNFPIIRVQYTYNPTVQDEKGNVLVGATVKITDTTGAAVSGSPFTTDSNGQINTYLTYCELSNLTPGGTGYNAATQTNKIPYTVTISKAGYKTTTQVISAATKTQGFISLTSPKAINMSRLVAQSD